MAAHFIFLFYALSCLFLTFYYLFPGSQKNKNNNRIPLLRWWKESGNVDISIWSRSVRPIQSAYSWLLICIVTTSKFESFLCANFWFHFVCSSSFVRRWCIFPWTVAVPWMDVRKRCKPLLQPCTAVHIEAQADKIKEITERTEKNGREMPTLNFYRLWYIPTNGSFLVRAVTNGIWVAIVCLTTVFLFISFTVFFLAILLTISIFFTRVLFFYVFPLISGLLWPYNFIHLDASIMKRSGGKTLKCLNLFEHGKAFFCQLSTLGSLLMVGVSKQETKKKTNIHTHVKKWCNSLDRFMEIFLYQITRICCLFVETCQTNCLLQCEFEYTRQSACVCN